MPKRIQIPQELLKRHPNRTLHEIRTIISVIINSKSNVIRQANIFKLRIPHLGVLKSHGNKKHKYSKSLMSKDRKRKSKQNFKKEINSEKILF